MKGRSVVTGHAGGHKPWGCLGAGPAQCCGHMPTPGTSALPHSGPLSCPPARRWLRGLGWQGNSLHLPQITRLGSDGPIHCPAGSGPGATLFTPSLIRHMCQVWGETVRPQRASWNVNSLFPCDTLPPTFISDLGWTSSLVLPQTLCVYMHDNT